MTTETPYNIYCCNRNCPRLNRGLFMGTNTSGKCKKNQNLLFALIGTLLSVAQIRTNKSKFWFFFCISTSICTHKPQSDRWIWNCHVLAHMVHPNVEIMILFFPETTVRFIILYRTSVYSTIRTTVGNYETGCIWLIYVYVIS